MPRDTRQPFDLNDPFGRNATPLANGRPVDAQPSGDLAHPATLASQKIDPRHAECLPEVAEDDKGPCRLTGNDNSSTQVGMDLAEFFIRERKNAQMSQRALARNLNVHHSYISQIEAGYKPLTARLALDMCALFDISPGTLFDEGGPFEGALVSNPDEVLVVRLLRRMAEGDRQTVIRTCEAFASAHAAKIHKPQR